MSEWPGLVGSFLLGGAVGLFFFGFLWVTVRKLPRSRRPLMLTMTSFLARLGASLAAFYLVARAGSWQHIVLCVAGFLVARTLLVRRWGTGWRRGSNLSEETPIWT